MSENISLVNDIDFAGLGLPDYLVKAVTDLGFTSPTPIQINSIPHILSGKDLLGLASTGSGKTAAFILPLLANMNVEQKKVQILVLSPTRELAIQVSKATETFIKYMRGVNVLPIYGGQPYPPQIRALKNGVNIVIATPGRLLDHIQKGTIDLSNLKAIVLDEADEMLSMGFADDLEKILDHIPESVQTALFSATMPKLIEKLTNKYLKDPQIIKIKKEKDNQPKIEQAFWLVQKYTKNQALLRFLEIEVYDGAIIFTRTKNGCTEVCDFLLKHGYSVDALHGDMNQKARETTLNNLRHGKIKILVATDIAARGLDIDSIDLVINYDMAGDQESYVHRVGRTGRAGREGKSITFVGEKERHELYALEKQTVKKELTEIHAPTNQELEAHRRDLFKKHLETKLNDHALEIYSDLVHQLIPTDYELDQVLAALINLATQDKRLILPRERDTKTVLRFDRDRIARDIDRRNNRGSRDFSSRDRRDLLRGERSFDIYSFSIGKKHNLEIKQLLQVISSVDNRIRVGRIKIFGDYTLIELPTNLNPRTFKALTGKRVSDLPLNLAKSYAQIDGFRNDDRGTRKFERGEDRRKREEVHERRIKSRFDNKKEEARDFNKRDDGAQRKDRKTENIDRETRAYKEDNHDVSHNPLGGLKTKLLNKVSKIKNFIQKDV